MHNYNSIVALEASCAVRLVKSMVLPAAIKYQSELASMIKAVEGVSKANQSKGTKALLKEVCRDTENIINTLADLESIIDSHKSLKTIEAMTNVRKAVDALEPLVPAQQWPLPSYAEMMFMM